MPEEKDETKAAWQLLLPKAPGETDRLYLVVTYQETKLALSYGDGKSEVAEGLLHFAATLLPRCHVEYETHKASSEIDTDLDKLFGDE
jgi:hypothetical protein